MHVAPPSDGIRFCLSVLPHSLPSSPLLSSQALATNGSENAPLQTVKVMQPVAVAVLDTGVDCFHRDLNVVFNKSFVPKDSTGWVASDANGCADVFNHGTNVAGARCTAAVVVQACPPPSAPPLQWPPSPHCRCISCTCG